MIPLIEDFLRSCLDSRIRWLKKNPDQIPKIFGVLGKRTSLKNFQEYVKNTDFKILLGYPREQNQVPCFVITLSGEQEVTAGLGDCIDEDIDGEDKEFDFHVETVYMETSYRIEVWSDNADLAVYMYILAKWAMWVSRKEMLENGFVLPRVTGADLEPAPEYFPVFIFRRALIVSLQYENQYYEEEVKIQEIEWNKTVVKSHLYTPKVESDGKTIDQLLQILGDSTREYDSIRLVDNVTSDTYDLKVEEGLLIMERVLR